MSRRSHSGVITQDLGAAPWPDVVSVRAEESLIND